MQSFRYLIYSWDSRNRSSFWSSWENESSFFLQVL